MKSISGAEILITGGAGFIGSTLAQRLVSMGSKVTILDAMIKPYGGNMFNIKSFQPQINFVRGDIRSENAINNIVDGKDFIFHLAGQTGRNISMENPLLDTTINSIGTLNVINAIKRMQKKPKLIFAGSRGVIGKPEYLPVDEDHVPKPRDVYGINKLAAEQYVLLYGSELGFGSTSLRLNNVYGPRCQIRSNHYGTVNLFISYALQNVTLPIYGSGEQTRDYVYVDDVVEAFIMSMSPKANGSFFFVGTGIPTSLLDIVEIIKKEIPSTEFKKIPFPDVLKSVDFPEFYSSSKKIQELLGWKANVSLAEGIKRTSSFYRSNLKHYL